MVNPMSMKKYIGHEDWEKEIRLSGGARDAFLEKSLVRYGDGADFWNIFRFPNGDFLLFNTHWLEGVQFSTAMYLLYFLDRVDSLSKQDIEKTISAMSGEAITVIVPATFEAPDLIFPYGPDFPSKTSELVSALAGNLEIDNETLDYSISSLDVIDSVIDSKPRSNNFKDSLFPFLIAYTGEVIRSCIDLSWHMKLLKDPLANSWHPDMLPAIAHSLGLDIRSLDFSIGSFDLVARSMTLSMHKEDVWKRDIFPSINAYLEETWRICHKEPANTHAERWRPCLINNSGIVFNFTNHIYASLYGDEVNSRGLSLYMSVKSIISLFSNSPDIHKYPRIGK